MISWSMFVLHNFDTHSYTRAHSSTHTHSHLHTYTLTNIHECAQKRHPSYKVCAHFNFIQLFTTKFIVLMDNIVSFFFSGYYLFRWHLDAGTYSLLHCFGWWWLQSMVALQKLEFDPQATNISHSEVENILGTGHPFRCVSKSYRKFPSSDEATREWKRCKRRMRLESRSVLMITYTFSLIISCWYTVTL